jgi:hypothetical protein
VSPSFSVVLVTVKLRTSGWVANGSLSVMDTSLTRVDAARHDTRSRPVVHDEPADDVENSRPAPSKG